MTTTTLAVLVPLLPFLGSAAGLLLGRTAPGFVRPYWRALRPRLNGAKRRSICRGLMRRSCWQTDADKPSRRRAQGNHSGSRAFSRTDQG